MTPPTPGIGSAERHEVVLRVSHEGARVDVKAFWGSQSREVLGARLAKSDVVAFSDIERSWADILKDLAASAPSSPPWHLQELGQLTLGDRLFQECFGSFGGNQLDWEHADLTVVTDDPYLSRLPWVLLARRNQFLTTMGATVSLAAQPPGMYPEARIPREWRFLAIGPDFDPRSPTGAADHLTDLSVQLSRRDPRAILAGRWRTARTWEEVGHGISEFKPHAVYFYGHATVESGAVRLALCQPKGRGKQDRSIVELAKEFQRLGSDAPRVVFVNCCHGDGAAGLGCGLALRPAIPAVVTQSHAANIDAARRQAVQFWSWVLADGMAPHEAVARLHRGDHPGASPSIDLRWFSPVLHRGYRTWRADPVPRTDPRIHEPYWDLLLDRVSQFGTIQYEADLMLRADPAKVRTLAYAWFGTNRQGVEEFGDRIEVQLPGRLGRSRLKVVTPELPGDECRRGNLLSQALDECLCRAFGIQKLDELPGAIRSWAVGNAGLKTVLYVKHPPLEFRGADDLAFYRSYITWWAAAIDPRLVGIPGCFVIHGVGFVVEDLEAFRAAALNVVQLEETLRFDHTKYRLLDSLSHVSAKDLHDFLDLVKVQLPAGQRDRVVAKVMEETRGVYRDVVDAFRRQIAEGRIPATSGAGNSPATPDSKEKP